MCSRIVETDTENEHRGGRVRMRFMVLAATLLSALPCAAAAMPPPLIPRALLLGEAQADFATLSPDGRWLCWARRDSAGIVNLWVRGIDRDTSWQVTNDRERGIRVGTWMPGSNRLLYLDDGDGDENDHVFSVEIATGRARDLTPFVGARAEGVHLDPYVHYAILVGLNVRDRRLFDMHRVDLESGAVSLEARNPGDVIEWTPDRRLRVRACTALRAGDVATILRVRDTAESPWRDLVTWSFDQAGFDRFQKIVTFLDDTTLLVQMWAGGNTARLVAMSTRDGRVLETLANDPRGDPWSFEEGGTDHPMVWLSADRRRVQAVGINYLKPEWRTLDPSVRLDFDALRRAAKGDVFRPIGRDSADTRWLVVIFGDRNPGRYALWERGPKRLTPLFETRPELLGATLATVKPVTIEARDGRVIPCYLTLPPGVPVKKLPLIALVHGGPWFRDEWTWDPIVQLLANRGYAVLLVQFRGSTGFGLDHMLAADHEFGPGQVLGDVVDAVRVMVARGTADPKRIGIAGYSFGGYATLAGLAFEPEVFACGVDVVGPSDLATLFSTFPLYWGPRRQRWINWMGDVERDAALNRNLSPLYHLDKMRAPLLIAHGANDARVKLVASETIVKALRERGYPVDFVVYPDEGHGFGRAENNLDFYGRVEEFLARHLRGRAEPWVKVEGSSVEVR
jgi:dipeptidyl aminopeptidase/acylaminoacyl peptidase